MDADVNAGVDEQQDRVHGIFGINAQMAAVLLSIVSSILVILALDGQKRKELYGEPGDRVFAKQMATASTVITSGLTLYYLAMSYTQYRRDSTNRRLLWFLAANILAVGAMLLKLQNTEQQPTLSAERGLEEVDIVE